MEKNSNVRFADDIILFAESEEQLENLLKDLNMEGKRDGIEINKKKTKIMCNEVAKTQHRRGILIEVEQLEEVNEYKYLGRLLTPENEMAKEMDQRITAGWRSLDSTAPFLKIRKCPCA